MTDLLLLDSLTMMPKLDARPELLHFVQTRVTLGGAQDSMTSGQVSQALSLS